MCSVFILHLAASYQGCREDDVKVRGINTDILKAGRIDVCHDNNRRPLCGEGFDANVARVICAELGFPMAGTISSHVNMM